MSRFFVLLLALLVSGCNLAPSVEKVGSGEPDALPVEEGGFACTLVGVPSVVAEIRDEAGKPAASGATVTIRKPSYDESSTGYGDLEPLTVRVGVSEKGPFDVYVTKPYYTEVVVKNVHVPTDECGVSEPARVKVTLSLVPNAPPVRQVVVPGNMFYGVGNARVELFANVVTAPGISQKVVWSSSDSNIASVTPDGLLTTMCPDHEGYALITATSAVDPTKQASFYMVVDIMDYPGNGCSSP